MLRKIYYLLGPKLRRTSRRFFFFPVDFIESITGSRQPLVPPAGLIFTGRGDFVKTGDDFLKKFITLGALQPQHKVLDVGCGIGRIARALAGYLAPEGCYEGFDIVEDGVSWCKKNYQEYPNFNFRYLPLRNDLYNLSVPDEADSFRFPYANQTFDLVILVSVFTHMQETAVKQYLSEIGRVLKSGKRCLCTFFLITPQSDKHLAQSPNPFFKYHFTNFYLHDNKVKDANVAYKYPVIEEMLTHAGLQIISFQPGWWAGHPPHENSSYQDILVLEKK